jgi:hypothetical protein
MKTSEKFGELIKALTKAQGNFGKAVFDKVNPHFKSKYASLDSVHDAIKEPLALHGLAISHLLSYREGTLLMETTLFHVSGEWMACEMPIVGGTTPQQLGSILSYYRRYSICCLLAIPSGEDDDGEEAERPKQAHHVAGAGKMTKEEPKAYISMDEASAIEDALTGEGELRDRILRTYKAKGFDAIEAKHLPIIWKGIRRDLAKNEDML